MTNDLGIRCDRHVGEVFPPRCDACLVATAEHATEMRSRRLGFIPGSACHLHTEYPLPCALCERITVRNDVAGGKSFPPDRRGNEHPESDLPKVNGPCPICWEPSHWANAAFNYVHPECDPATSPTTRTEQNS